MAQNKNKRDLGSRGLHPATVRGQAGHRTRNNRSGLDPLDTYAETGRMEGLFWRNLFTFRLRTRNPLHLVFMILGSLFFLWPILAIFYASGEGIGNGLICIGLYAIPGLFLLGNFILSLLPRQKQGTVKRKKKEN